MEAALSWLAPLLSALAVCLDVWLPFPVHRGRAALGTEAAAGAPERRRGRTAGSAAARIGPCKWTSPCVEHPFTARWNYFSIYDGICTSEFATATRLLDEDLRHLCACQGELVSPETGTLQLLAHLLRAAHLGCLSPPAPAGLAAVHLSTSQVCASQAGSAGGTAAGSPSASGTLQSGAEDNDWTVLEHSSKRR